MTQREQELIKRLDQLSEYVTIETERLDRIEKKQKRDEEIVSICTLLLIFAAIGNGILYFFS